MQNPRRTPRLIAVPLVLFAVGLWLTMTYGERWYHLPKYSEQDISASVELNLMMDLQRRGSEQKPEAAEIEQLRAQIRREIEADLGREREDVQQHLVAGLVSLLLGIGLLVTDRMLSRRV